MLSTKALPSSDISLISSASKCKCRCIRRPCWNIPQISNLYPIDDASKSMPLSKISLNCTISNSSASISFMQTFVNDSTNPIECIYKFPCDYSFSVTGLKVQVGDRYIEAEVMEKKLAEEKYDDAVAAGHTAVKLNYNEKLPDIIELNVGQLQPGDSVVITVRMVCELEVIKHGFFSFIFPLEFFPRYGDYEGLVGQTGEFLPAEFEADFSIQSDSLITNLDVSHKGFTFEQSEDGLKVRMHLEPSKDTIAKDLVISYSTENIREPKLVLKKCAKYPGEIAAHITFIPRGSDEHDVDGDEEFKDSDTILTEVDDHDDPEVANGEFIFILDRSGSMGGHRIEVAKEALSLFIRSIPPNSKFNIVSFGSSHEFMYPNSVEYNNDNRQDALNKIESFNSNFGGTELFNPIASVLNMSSDVKFPKNIFILTDGCISDVQRVLDKIKEFNYQARVHSFGIGSGASIYLVKEIAKEGKGSSTLISDNDPHLKSKVIRTLKLASKPAFTGIKINWNENLECIKFSVPHIPFIPNFYEEEPFNYYSILSESSLSNSTLDLELYNTLKGESQFISLEVDPSKIHESINGQEFELAAKHYLDHLNRLIKSENHSCDEEIIAISTKYSVLSNKTAFFGKIKNVTTSTEEMKTIEIPVKSLHNQREGIII